MALRLCYTKISVLCQEKRTRVINQSSSIQLSHQLCCITHVTLGICIMIYNYIYIYVYTYIYITHNHTIIRDHRHISFQQCSPFYEQMTHWRSIHTSCHRGHSGVQLSGSAVGRVVTATVHDARGTVDEGAIAGVHAIVHPLLPETMER